MAFYNRREMIMYLSQFAFCCCNNTMTKSNFGEERVYLGLWVTAHPQPAIPRQGLKARKNLEAGNKQWPWAKAAYGLAPRLTFSSPSFIAQAHLPKDGTTHSGLGTPRSIIVQDDAPQTCPRASLAEVIPQLGLPPPRCVRVATEISHHNTFKTRTTEASLEW